MIIGSVTSIITIVIFVIVYIMNRRQFEIANSDLEETQVIFKFDQLFFRKRNSVESTDEQQNL